MSFPRVPKTKMRDEGSRRKDTNHFDKDASNEIVWKIETIGELVTEHAVEAANDLQVAAKDDLDVVGHDDSVG